MNGEKLIYNYFVDEAGDTTLFTKKKVPAQFGLGGASKYFMLGAVKLQDPNLAETILESVRIDLLADPTLTNIPSLQKTAHFFHAKDDHQTVRREVFKALEAIPFSIQVAVRRKSILANQAKFLFENFGKKFLNEKSMMN